MSDEPDNLVLVYLRRIDAKLDLIIEDIAEIKRCLTRIEAQVRRFSATQTQRSIELERQSTNI